MVVKNSFLEFIFLFSVLTFGLVWRLVELPEFIACYKPDFLLLGLFFIVIYAPTKMNIWLAWLIGIFADSINGFVLGSEALQLAFMAMVVNIFYRRIYLYSAIQQSLVLMMISFITAIINILIYQIIFDIPNYCQFYSVVSNTLLWPLFYIVANRLHRQSYSIK